MYKKLAFALLFVMSSVSAQTYDSTSLVDTNNTTTSTSTVTSTSNNTNTNNNISTSTMSSTSTNTNINQNTSTSTNNNTNFNYGHTTSDNVNTNTSNNTNVNTNTSTSTNTNNNVNTGDMTNRNINSSDSKMKIEQPPPTAVAPSMMSGGNSDLCTTGVSGAVQTQIFGLSFGTTVTDKNCERLKLSKTLFDMGMKVAAVATMCQDRRVWDAMMAAGTPCPFDGLIGEAAKKAWNENPNRIPSYDSKTAEVVK